MSQSSRGALIRAMLKGVGVATLLALAAAPAVSEDPKPREVYTWDVQGYRYEDVQAGDWVEYRTVKTEGGKSGEPTFLRLACVRRGKTRSRIERCEGTGKDWRSGVTLYRVDRETGEANAAWWGEAGKTGEPLPLKDFFLSAMPEEVWETVCTTASVGRESIELDGKAYDCEKIVLRSERRQMKDGKETGKKAEQVTTWWLHKEIPFPRAKWNAGSLARYKWEGTPVWEGGVVRHRMESPWRTVTMDLTSFGKDAKPTIEVK